MASPRFPSTGSCPPPDYLHMALASHKPSYGRSLRRFSPLATTAVVNRARGYAQTTGDRRDCFARGDFKDGQGAAVDTGVVSGSQLLFQPPLLPEGQGQGVHCQGLPPSPSNYQAPL